MGPVDDRDLCESSRDIHAIKPDMLCGGGLPQPTWEACRIQGAWEVRGYRYPYCTAHAAARLRGHARLAEMRAKAAMS
jgi:hypothetical protein